MEPGGLLDFICLFSALCLGAGTIIVTLEWIAIKTQIIHPQNLHVAIARAWGISLALAGLYSIILFCPILGWIARHSNGAWAFLWFIIGCPIWVFCAGLYGNPDYRVAINNLHGRYF